MAEVVGAEPTEAAIHEGARVCPLCDAPIAGRLRAREMMLGLRDPFHYGECSSCSTLVLVDPPEDLGPYYPSDYYSLRPPTRSRRIVRFAKRLRAEAAAGGMKRTAEWIGLGAGAPRWSTWLEASGLDRSASICDVGCGSGYTLCDMRGDGFTDLVGVDPFIERSISRDGVEIHKATAAELSGSFDLVMFNHSFEHVPDPIATLRAARDLLAPGGSVMVRSPVAGCWAWRRYGADWIALDPPRHLFVPSEPGIRAAAERVGLEVYEVVHDSTDVQFWGSEQYCLDIPLVAPTSHMIDPAGSPYTRRQIRAWKRAAERLNRAGEGDTVATFLRSSGSRQLSA